MVFEVRGGPISMYFRSKIGISLGRHFCDHLDLISSSFWVTFLVQEATRERLFDIKKSMDCWLSKKTSNEMPEVARGKVAAGGGTPMKTKFLKDKG